jgi:hypothetical protein
VDRVFFEWFYFDHFAVWCWFWLLVMWAVFAAGRWIVVKLRRQPKWNLLTDRPRRRFSSTIFLLSLLIAGVRIDRCPHATYVQWWDLVGVSYHRPCGYKGFTVHRLAGELYLYGVH